MSRRAGTMKPDPDWETGEAPVDAPQRPAGAKERAWAGVAILLPFAALAFLVAAVIFAAPVKSAEVEELTGPACPGNTLPIGAIRADLDGWIEAGTLGQGRYLEAAGDPVSVIIAFFEALPVAATFVFAGGCLIAFDDRAFAPIVIELLGR